MAQSIRESTAKDLLGAPLVAPCAMITATTNLNQLETPHPWLLTSHLVAKPDVLNAASKLGTPHTVGAVTGVLDTFIVEKFHQTEFPEERRLTLNKNKPLRTRDPNAMATSHPIRRADARHGARSLGSNHPSAWRRRLPNTILE